MLAYFGHLTAVVLAIFSQNMFWVYGIFMAIGVGQGAFMPSAMNLIYDFADDRDTKTYMALVDSFLAPFVLIFILGIGAFIKMDYYSTSLYIIGTCIIIGMCILQFIVKDPKKSPKLAFNSDGFSS
jgi:MFS family permease